MLRVGWSKKLYPTRNESPTNLLQNIKIDFNEYKPYFNGLFNFIFLRQEANRANAKMNKTLMVY